MDVERSQNGDVSVDKSEDFQPGAEGDSTETIPWEAEATLQGNFKVKVKGETRKGIKVIELLENFVEPMVVEAILSMAISMSSPNDEAPLTATFTDKDGQVLSFICTDKKGETDPTLLFTRVVMSKLVRILGDATYHVVGLNKHEKKTE